MCDIWRARVARQATCIPAMYLPSSDCMSGRNIAWEGGAVSANESRVFVCVRKTKTGVVVTLIRGQFVQSHSFPHVLPHPYALLMHEAEIELRARDIFARSELVQPRCLRAVFGNANAVAMPAHDERRWRLQGAGAHM